MKVFEAEQKRVIGLRVGGLDLAGRGGFFAGQLHGQCRDDVGDDLVLKSEDVAQRAVVALGPEVMVVDGVDELGVDPDLVALAPHAAFEHVADVQVLGHLLRRD